MNRLVVVSVASRARAIPKSITRGPSGAEDDVVRFEITVDHVGEVDRGERGSGPDGQPVQCVTGQRPVFADPPVQRRPVR